MISSASYIRPLSLRCCRSSPYSTFSCFYTLFSYCCFAFLRAFLRQFSPCGGIVMHFRASFSTGGSLPVLLKLVLCYILSSFSVITESLFVIYMPISWICSMFSICQAPGDARCHDFAGYKGIYLGIRWPCITFLLPPFYRFAQLICGAP